jgi:UDP:flavonoid glycosyltransferase YjiC (YdhE family)
MIGSNDMKDSVLSQKFNDLLIEVFSKLPYQVLWKLDSSSLKKKISKNVKISNWFPQQDILGHDKIKAFITHGGLLSLFETVYHGTPIVVMPVFYDQDVNSERAKIDGYGLKFLKCLSS